MNVAISCLICFVLNLLMISSLAIEGGGAPCQPVEVTRPGSVTEKSQLCKFLALKSHEYCKPVIS
jgi:hypothetical protein